MRDFFREIDAWAFENLEGGNRGLADLFDIIGRLTAAIRQDEREACAKIADTGMLVPPDGGSPTQDEIDVAERIAAAIRARKSA